MALFAVGSWVLAQKYNIISYEFPFVMRGEQVPEKTCLGKRSWNIVMITLNTVATLADEGLRNFGKWKYEKYSKNINQKFLDAVEICHLVHCSLLMFSSIILIRSVIRIHSYLKDQEGNLNRRTLLIHALTFGLFLATLIYQVVLSL